MKYMPFDSDGTTENADRLVLLIMSGKKSESKKRAGVLHEYMKEQPE